MYWRLSWVLPFSGADTWSKSAQRKIVGARACAHSHTHYFLLSHAQNWATHAQSHKAIARTTSVVSTWLSHTEACHMHGADLAWSACKAYSHAHINVLSLPFIYFFLLFRLLPFLLFPSLSFTFLLIPSHLYKRSCPSVGPSVPCYFRRWKVRILGASCAVYPALFSIFCNTPKLINRTKLKKGFEVHKQISLR